MGFTKSTVLLELRLHAHKRCILLPAWGDPTCKLEKNRGEWFRVVSYPSPLVSKVAGALTGLVDSIIKVLRQVEQRREKQIPLASSNWALLFYLPIFPMSLSCMEGLTSVPPV